MATKFQSKTTKKTTAAKTAKSTKTTKGTSARTAKSGVRGKSAQADMWAPIMRRIKSTGWLAILESLVIGALGIALLIHPKGVVQLIFYVVGIFLMIKGVYKIINYFAVRGAHDFYNNDLLYGIVALVFGIVAVVLWEQLGDVISVIVGAWMIYGALVRMNTAVKLHAAGVKEWFYVLLLSMVMLALGIYMVINYGALLEIVGWVMIAAAVVGVIDDLVFIRHLDEIA